MADITKCTGKTVNGDCPTKESCYRYTAPANEFWQSYIPAPTIWIENHVPTCFYYLEDKWKSKFVLMLGMKH